MRAPDSHWRVETSAGCIHASAYRREPAPALVVLPERLEAPIHERPAERRELAEAMQAMHDRGHPWSVVAKAYGYASNGGPLGLIGRVLNH